MDSLVTKWLLSFFIQKSNSKQKEHRWLPIKIKHASLKCPIVDSRMKEMSPYYTESDTPDLNENSFILFSKDLYYTERH